MKKVILNVAICTLTLVSCNKKQINPTVDNSTTVNNGTPSTTNGSLSRTSGSNYRIMFLSPDASICVCASTGGNCLPDIIISAKSFHDVVITKVIDAIHTGDQKAVQRLFSDNRDKLSDIIDISDIDGIIKGALVLNTANSPKGDIKFLIFKNASDNEVTVAYPFTY